MTLADCGPIKYALSATNAAFSTFIENNTTFAPLDGSASQMTTFTMAAITDPSLAGVHTVTLSGSLEDHPGLDAVMTVVCEFTFTAEAGCNDTVFVPS